MIFLPATVQRRFCIGTDVGGAGAGWTIDDIAFQGIDNTPSTTVVPHAGVCQVPPIASAGPDRFVEKTAGPDVALINANTAHASFRTPAVRSKQVILILTFQVQASDAFESTTDSVSIIVVKRRGALVDVESLSPQGSSSDSGQTQTR